MGCIVREDVTAPANFRSEGTFQHWLELQGKIGLSGIDTRALTRRIRRLGAPNAVIAHAPDGVFDMSALLQRARNWPGLEGMDLARKVSREAHEAWEGSIWRLHEGFTRPEGSGRPHVVAIDYGAKDNIFRNLVAAGADVTVVPAETSLDTVLGLKPVFGICLGHQMLALAAGAKTIKMHQGHRGANHPVKRLDDSVVEITSMNHGFAVDAATLPEGVVQTHISLFDGSNCGIEITGKAAFSVQYHPEASPGPQDSFYLFEKFVGAL